MLKVAHQSYNAAGDCFQRVESGSSELLAVQGNSLQWKCAPDGYLMGSLPGEALPLYLTVASFS